MKRLLSCLAVTAAVALSVASTTAPDSETQGGARGAVLRDGPYQVVMSKPILGSGWKVGSKYTENKHLTELMNQLAADGLQPLFTNVITERANGLEAQDRLVVICKKP